MKRGECHDVVVSLVAIAGVFSDLLPLQVFEFKLRETPFLSTDDLVSANLSSKARTIVRLKIPEFYKKHADGSCTFNSNFLKMRFFVECSCSYSIIGAFRLYTFTYYQSVV